MNPVARPSAPVSIPGRFPDQNLLASKSGTSSEAPLFRCQDVFLHHSCLSKHSLSLKTRLVERRVLACDSLILGFPSGEKMWTRYPLLPPFSPPKRPLRPLFLQNIWTSATSSTCRESSIQAGFLGLGLRRFRFPTGVAGKGTGNRWQMAGCHLFPALYFLPAGGRTDAADVEYNLTARMQAVR